MILQLPIFSTSTEGGYDLLVYRLQPEWCSNTLVYQIQLEGHCNVLFYRFQLQGISYSLIYQLRLEGYYKTLHRIWVSLAQTYHPEVFSCSNLKETPFSCLAPPFRLAQQATTFLEGSNHNGPWSTIFKINPRVLKYIQQQIVI